MRILHLTDTHLFGDASARHYDRIDTDAALRGLLARFDDVAGIDAVVHTGDASEDGTAESYRRLHGILDPFAAARDAVLTVVMGNHDASSAYAEEIALGDRRTTVQDRVTLVPGGGRIVALDSSVPGAGYGHLDREQLDWLAEVLDQTAPWAAGGAAVGTVLAIHHPPVVAAGPMMRALDLDGLDELAAILAGSDVRLVLSGHYHHALAGSIAGIPVHVAPGVTNVSDPLTAGGSLERAFPLSGASLVDLGADAPRVVTSIYPSTGDVRGEPETPVYAFDADTIRAIIAQAGRPA